MAKRIKKEIKINVSWSNEPNIELISKALVQLSDRIRAKEKLKEKQEKEKKEND